MHYTYESHMALVAKKLGLEGYLLKIAWELGILNVFV